MNFVLLASFFKGAWLSLHSSCACQSLVLLKCFQFICCMHNPMNLFILNTLVLDLQYYVRCIDYIAWQPSNRRRQRRRYLRIGELHAFDYYQFQKCRLCQNCVFTRSPVCIPHVVPMPNLCEQLICVRHGIVNNLVERILN